MKIATRLLIMLVLVFGFAEAKMFQTVAPEKAELLQTGKGKLYCPNCGMNLVMFYKTSHAMKQHDGSTHQYCSMHCLVEANDQINADAQVVDVSGLKFINAHDAHYVVGSSKKGTMTMNSKYAFAAKADAEAFAKANGGKVMSFADAVKIAGKAINKENMMIDKKRGKMAEKGKMMYGKMCKATDLPEFASIADAKTHIVDSGVCGKLEDKQFQAIAIYLFRKGK
ncbi:MAG: nitrous oxide reductase accessory protein NosL [Campylobacterota bacterium]|nr:nitrous oxide reductase accessory protein NosL [Campylobacterota bacterium]